MSRRENNRKIEEDSKEEEEEGEVEGMKWMSCRMICVGHIRQLQNSVSIS